MKKIENKKTHFLRCLRGLFFFALFTWFPEEGEDRERKGGLAGYSTCYLLLVAIYFLGGLLF